MRALCGATVFIVLILSNLVLIQGQGQADIGGCCSEPFSSSVIRQLREHEAEPLESKATWLSKQLDGKSTEDLQALQAGLEAYCVKTCPEYLQLAKAVVAERLAQRALNEDKKARWTDRAVELLCAFISLVGAIVASFAAGLVQRRV